MLLTVFKYTNA